ncbi:MULTISPECIES: MarR family winged helix-turn-helix transcriptional regulator [Vibrio]|uniref:MarR family transcriptional regulator n=1 Tax=Vibrio casei TaxID=673372 RepID=A0A368LJ83_9VIBR|nr:MULTISPECIES: MarR family transcriptional regulator [Vibrio]RCS70809.1 MarR family transcriptional regulator [Vibrio casei]HBV76870.1 MarR family transcriptional regulator [Vibrio sp.]
MMKDPVDTILQQWLQVRPDLDCSSMGVVGRVRRTSEQWKKQMEKVFKQHQLNSIEFDILATLRRSQAPLTPTELYQTLMLSSGVMSTRIESLVQRGLLQRLASEEDRRSCRVELTAEGMALIDLSVVEHVQNMESMLSPLNKKERDQLATLLKKLQ